jgi:hypothetical protein
MKHFAVFGVEPQVVEEEPKETLAQRNYRRAKNFGGAVGVGLAVSETRDAIRAGAGATKEAIQERLARGIQLPEWAQHQQGFVADAGKDAVKYGASNVRDRVLLQAIDMSQRTGIPKDLLLHEYYNYNSSGVNVASFGLLTNNPIHGIAGTIGAATGITSAISDSNAEYEDERKRILNRITDPYQREQALKQLDSLGSRAKRFSSTAQNAAIRGALYGGGSWAGSHAIGQVFGAGRRNAQPTGVN